jgi:hypothetical protein
MHFPSHILAEAFSAFSGVKLRHLRIIFDPRTSYHVGVFHSDPVIGMSCTEMNQSRVWHIEEPHGLLVAIPSPALGVWMIAIRRSPKEALNRLIRINLFMD